MRSLSVQGHVAPEKSTVTKFENNQANSKTVRAGQIIASFQSTHSVNSQGQEAAGVVSYQSFHGHDYLKTFMATPFRMDTHEWWSSRQLAGGGLETKIQWKNTNKHLY